jgi:lysophospholipase L1-like esterase
MTNSRRWLLRILSLAVGCAVSFALLEVILRIKEPFEFRTRGDKIVLRANSRFVYHNSFTDRGLDETIINRRNALGFRGEDYPRNAEQSYKVITVGGSTTECFVLNDGRTWPDVLGQKLKSTAPNLWLNNAGLDGHSTFGHIILLRDHILKLKPDLVVFLIGVNDAGRTDLKAADRFIIRKPSFVERLATHSEVCSAALNFHRNWRARQLHVSRDEFVNFKEKPALELPEADAKRMIDSHQEPVRLFRERVATLLEMCRSNGITPVLVTQPALFCCGHATDPSTGIDLSTVQLTADKNGCLGWRLMELYNEQTRQAGKEAGVLVVDLAEKMPHDSKFYIDWFHYNNPGAAKVGEIIYEEIRSLVASERQKKAGAQIANGAR